ncbi:MAG: hypothetical protein N2D54_09000 [Chloroflexota bacterium]
MKRYFILAVGILAACNLSTPLNTPAPIEQASPTIQLAPTVTPTPTEDLTAIELATAQAELVNANITITAQAEKIKSLRQDLKEASTTSTPSIAPTSSLPASVVNAKAAQRTNLRRIKEYNNAGKPFMVIYEPRIQYQTGEIIQVYKGVIIGDGAHRFYEVYGPKGGGLFVRTEDVNLP